MKRTIDFQISDLEAIMEEYADVTIEFTDRTELNSQSLEENIVYVELGQSLDIFGMDEVYYDSSEKRYFIFFSTFLHHLDKATRKDIHWATYTFMLENGQISAINMELT